MSRENVGLVLASLDAYNAGDIDGMLRFYSFDVVAIPDRSVFPEAAPLHGRDAFRDWAIEIGRAWDSVRWEIEEARAIGTDRVLLRGDWGGIGHGSGLNIASSFSGVLTVRDGQINRVEYFQDHAEALKAVKLEE
jgi:ketosteroid isomerase-like protein